MKHRQSLKKIIILIAVILSILAAGLLYVYINLNRLLTDALNNGFNTNIISDVYALEFQDLDVNILTGSVKVLNVKMSPREKPLHDYPGINSSFRLEAHKMILKNVNLIKLLSNHSLDLKKIELVEPGITFTIADEVPVFFPFKEAVPGPTEKSNKRSIETYFLEEFSMSDAYFHVVNTAKVREFDFQKINISLRDMLINRQAGHDMISYDHFDFSVGELTGKLKSKNLRYIHFKDFNVSIDSLRLEETPDTIMYHFADLTSGIKNLDIQTADSLFHLTMESFQLGYKEKSIEFDHLTFKPNISNTAMQRNYLYRKGTFAGSVGSIKVHDLNFDSLMYAQKLLIGEILLDDVSLAIFTDLRKPFPPNHRPEYLGQQIMAIGVPIAIGKIKVTKLNLVNSEVTPDGANGKANINRATVTVEHITNLAAHEVLTVTADAYIENEAHAHIQLGFLYHQPQFSIDGRVEPFDFTRLNELTNSYAPARITKGMSDGITFSGNVYETKSTGTMKFLYHDLVVDFEIEDKAKWKSTLLGFAANTYLHAANPAGPNLPERVVQFEVIRDMRKGYLSMLIKSVLDGVKETFIMSKENKEAYREDKKEARSKRKEKQ